MFQAGDRIATWVVVKPLGEGGMGSVYLCHSAMSERIRAAVKVLKANRLDDDMGRFVREVEALDALRHPGVVRVKGFGDDPAHGVLWLAMEYVEGEDLEQRRERGPMDPAEAARVFAEVADGLAHAHAHRICHRDIKPANILVCRDGSGRVVDFGIAVQSDRTRLTQAGMVVGTPSYMAPEIFDGGVPDLARVDVYALGQVLHEALVGRPAFPSDPSLSTGQAMMRLIGQKTRGEPLDPGPGVPEALRAVVRKATAPDPRDRYRTMAEFATALAAARDARVPDAPAPAPVAGPPAGEEPAQTAPPGPVEASAEETRWVAEPRYSSAPGDGVSDAPAAGSRRPRRRAAFALFAGLFVAAAAAILALVGAGAGGAWWWKVGRLVDADLQVTGLTPVRLWVGTQELASTVEASGAAVRFDYHGVPGPGEVSLIAGPQCREATDWGEWAPGSACPDCCQCETTSVDLVHGGTASLAFEPEHESKRPVVVTVARHQQWPTWYLDGKSLVPITEMNWTLAPATYPIPLARGACAAADIGCSDGGTCPPGCASSRRSLDVPCGRGEVRAVLDLPQPEGDPLGPYLGKWKLRSPSYDITLGVSGDAAKPRVWVEATQKFEDGFWYLDLEGSGRNVRFVDGTLRFQVLDVYDAEATVTLRPAPPLPEFASATLLWDRGEPTTQPLRLTQ